MQGDGAFQCEQVNGTFTTTASVITLKAAVAAGAQIIIDRLIIAVNNLCTSSVISVKDASGGTIKLGPFNLFGPDIYDTGPDLNLRMGDGKGAFLDQAILGTGATGSYTAFMQLRG